MGTVKVTVKPIAIQGWTDPSGSSRLRLPEFIDIRLTKVAMLSALHTGRLYCQEIPLVIYIYKRNNVM